MGIEKLVVKHRLERGEIAAAHRRIALVLEGEDFLVAAHRQTSLAVFTTRFEHAPLPSAFIQSPRRRARAAYPARSGARTFIRCEPKSENSETTRDDQAEPANPFRNRPVRDHNRPVH